MTPVFLREWLELRKRVWDEFSFHLERAESEFFALGLSRDDARRAARQRFGGRRLRGAALRELGADLSGLVALFRAHQVSASAWLRPLVLVTGLCFLAVLSDAFHGASRSLYEPPMGIAQAVWCSVGVWAFVLTRWREGGASKNWPAYGALVLGLHGLASIMAWAVAMRVWNQLRWQSDGRALLTFITVFALYLCSVLWQCRDWWQDLHRRCPVCLDRLRLPQTEGSFDRVLLGSSSTASVCIHGHGSLIENRWARAFARADSALERLIGA